MLMDVLDIIKLDIIVHSDQNLFPLKSRRPKRLQHTIIVYRVIIAYPFQSINDFSQRCPCLISEAPYPE